MTTISTSLAPEGIAEFVPMTPRPYYECTRQGVFYIAVETDKEGNNPTFKAPMRLSDEIALIGQGVDDAGQYYRVISWQDSMTRQRKTEAIPMSEIGNNWSKLQGMGIAILANRRKRELLADYLQTEGQKTKYTITRQSGWVSKQAYVLPNSEIISHSAQTERVIYYGDKSQAKGFNASGTLEDWKTHVASYMADNSRLCLAVGTALAAPLVSLLGLESGGFHLFGDSRDGKSTANNVALSVWGNPEVLKVSWSGTGLGFSNLANARNDGFLSLDEIGQAIPHHASKTVYQIFNGISKAQGAAEGGNREIQRWNTLVLSNGEKPLDVFFQATKTDWNAGQAARLPSVESNAGKGFGLFDTLHGLPTGAILSEHLKQAINQYHGTAGKAFVSALLEHSNALDEARQIMAKFMATLPDVNGQSRTVAMRFALVAAALELAAQYGVTGLEQDTAIPAIKQCFNAWLEREGGTGKFEDRKIMENATAFMQQFASSHRFDIYPFAGGIAERSTSSDLAGYKKISSGLDGDYCSFYILPAVFTAEICKGFDKGKVISVLHDADWLKQCVTPSETRWTHKLKGKGRFYLLMGALPPSELSDEDHQSDE